LLLLLLLLFHRLSPQHRWTSSCGVPMGNICSSEMPMESCMPLRCKISSLRSLLGTILSWNWSYSTEASLALQLSQGQQRLVPVPLPVEWLLRLNYIY
jgi:hypothetical protein